jgi:hypothetical protein
MIEWLCTQKRLNPEVAITFGTAARYRRAEVGSSHDDAHPENLTLRPHFGFVEKVFIILFRKAIVFKCSKCCQLFRSFRRHALFVRGMTHPHF